MNEVNLKKEKKKKLFLLSYIPLVQPLSLTLNTSRKADYDRNSFHHFRGLKYLVSNYIFTIPKHTYTHKEQPEIVPLQGVSSTCLSVSTDVKRNWLKITRNLWEMEEESSNKSCIAIPLV